MLASVKNRINFKICSACMNIFLTCYAQYSFEIIKYCSSRLSQSNLKIFSEIMHYINS